MKSITVGVLICLLPTVISGTKVQSLDGFYPGNENEVSLPNAQTPCKTKKGEYKGTGDSIPCTKSSSSQGPSMQATLPSRRNQTFDLPRHLPQP